MERIKDIDLYELLEVSPEATEREIRTAYRKKALKCHPDKNPDRPVAVELFHRLSDALEVLTDAAARKSYDTILKARKANLLRHKKLDAQRKKFKDDLEVRESSAAASAASDYYDCRTEEERLKAEIERLRREGRQQLEEEQRRLRKVLENGSQDFDNTEVSGPSRIKVRWKEAGRYDDIALKRIFSKYGDVSAVATISGKNSALIEYADPVAASNAAQIERGYIDSPLKVKLLLDVASGMRSAAAVPVSGFNDYESLVMRQMRQAEERKRLTEEIMAQDKLEYGVEPPQE